MQAHFQRGRFKGQPIDVRTRRSIAIVAEDQDTLTVDHFFHRGQFHRAVIPRNAVKRIHGQLFNFSSGAWLRNPMLNHAQARFVLDPAHPIRLYPMDRPPAEPIATLHDIVYSVEVASPHGVSWDLAYAFGDLVCAHRLLSTEEVLFERVVLGGYRVRQSAELRLTPDERNRALESVLRRSHAAGMHQPYYLIDRHLRATNCTSSILDVLDEILACRYTPMQRLISRMLWRLPLHPRRYLRLRSALPSAAAMPALNEELAALAASPGMLRRRAALLGA